jgi:cytochrome c oxidase assembly protein subunit 15
MTNNEPVELQKTLSRYTLIVLLTTVLINLLSAYIRHTEAGLGCEPWPDCYAIIGEQSAVDGSSEIAQRALAPTHIAKQMHRIIATILVIAVLLLIHQSRKPGAMRGLNPTLPYLLLAVIILLSVIGPASYLKTLPVIALINLAGGLALMAIGWWLYLEISRNQLKPIATVITIPVGLKRLWQIVWILLVVQILLGGWVSANFAADACQQLLSCAAREDYAGQGHASFWYFRELTIDPNGRVLFDGSAVTIHMTHRIFALLTGLTLLIAALFTFRYNKPTTLIIASLLIIQWLLGIFSIFLHLPLMLIMVHNLNAALLLAAVMTINFQLLRAQ